MRNNPEVWRVENAEGVGPYHGEVFWDRKTGEVVGEHDVEVGRGGHRWVPRGWDHVPAAEWAGAPESPAQPSGYEDMDGSIIADDVFGFPSQEAAIEWFGLDVIERLASVGWHLKVGDVATTRVSKSGKQVTFRPNPEDDDGVFDALVRENPRGGGEVVEKLDAGMYEDIMLAKAGDGAAKGRIAARYRKYAKNSAVKYLTTRPHPFTRAAASGIAGDVASEVLERLLYGKETKKGVRTPAIETFQQDRSSLATWIGNLVKNVAREGARSAKHTRQGKTTVAGESEIEQAPSTRASPEEEVEDAEEVDAIDMTPAQARKVQEMIESGELSAQDEVLAQRALDRWRGAESAPAVDAAEAVDLAMDSAGAGDGLSSDEAEILGMRNEVGADGKPKSYKQIAIEKFGSADKKNVQKVMVRLHRARKSLERTIGTPLRGIEASLGGIGYSARGRKRKNPEEDVCYFEDFDDLDDMLTCGVIDSAGYQAGLVAMLQCLGDEG